MDDAAIVLAWLVQSCRVSCLKAIRQLDLCSREGAGEKQQAEADCVEDKYEGYGSEYVETRTCGQRLDLLT